MLDSYKVLEFPRILNSIAGSCRTEIAKQLDEIAAAHFDGIEKTIKRKQ